MDSDLSLLDRREIPASYIEQSRFRMGNALLCRLKNGMPVVIREGARVREKTKKLPEPY